MLDSALADKQPVAPMLKRIALDRERHTCKKLLPQDEVETYNHKPACLSTPTSPSAKKGLSLCNERLSSSWDQCWRSAPAALRAPVPRSKRSPPSKGLPSTSSTTGCSCSCTLIAPAPR